MTYYIWVSVLSEEDVCPKKFGRKKHRVFKMHIVVPSRIFYFIEGFVCLIFYNLKTPGAVNEEKTVVPYPGCSRNQRGCHVTFLVILRPKKRPTVCVTSQLLSAEYFAMYLFSITITIMLMVMVMLMPEYFAMYLSVFNKTIITITVMLMVMEIVMLGYFAMYLSV